MDSVPGTSTPESVPHVWSDCTYVYINAVNAGLDNDCVSRLCATVKGMNYVGKVDLTSQGCIIITPKNLTTDSAKKQQIKADLVKWCADTLKHRVAAKQGAATKRAARRQRTLAVR